MWCPIDKESNVERLARWALAKGDWVCSGDVPAEFGKTARLRACAFNNLCRNKRFVKEVEIRDSVVVRGARNTRVKSKFVKVTQVNDRRDIPRPIMGVNAKTGQVAEFASLHEVEKKGGFDLPDVRLALSGLSRVQGNGFSRDKHPDKVMPCYSQGYIWLDLTKITP